MNYDKLPKALPQIENVYSKGFQGISHVGVANYASRESEAKGELIDAYDEAVEVVDKIDNSRQELYEALKTIVDNYEFKMMFNNTEHMKLAKIAINNAENTYQPKPKSKQVAKLVYYSFVTRVVVDENATEAETVAASKASMLQKVQDDLYENLEDIVDDVEMPAEV